MHNRAASADHTKLCIFATGTPKIGFSLVELSIVLVILGLLTGGILTGQNLIRASEIKSVATDLQKYQTALLTFRDKYLAIPGDMANATNFWGAANADPTICSTTDSRALSDPKLTCNGNGDGKASQNATTAAYERFRFWHHLANAGLIEGNFSGTSYQTTVSDATPGFNCPTSRMSNGGFSVQFQYNEPTAILKTGIPMQHIVWFGADRDTGNTFGPILTPTEAWSIDAKIDDGEPGNGKVIGPKLTFTAAPNCTTSDDPATASYNLASDEVLCGLTFFLGF